MIRKIKIALTLFVVCSYADLSAQQTVYYSGVGRALFSNENLVDETNNLSEIKASGGYTMFDLGIYAEPDEVLRASVILRQRTEFGGFFDNGSSLEFRQMQLEGLIAKKVKYEIGDIYLDHTKYTLWNEASGNNEFESSLFSLRRDIAHYENFIVDNKWRMQGVNSEAKLINFEKGIESIGLRVYGGRTRPTNMSTIPDRYFYGSKLSLVQSKYFKIAGNVAGITDIVGTVEDTEVAYDNIVYSTDFEANLAKGEKMKFALKGEVGASNFSLTRFADTTKKVFNDFFYDLGAEATYNPLKLTIGLSYRDVGFNFNSPMAQSRRMAAPSDISMTYFPTLNDDATARPFTLYDGFAQESNMYNQSISTTLMNYYIQYDLVEPYGNATPNRKGLTVNAKIGEADQVIRAKVELDLLSEGVSEGDSISQAKRSFMKLQGGFVFNINKLVGFEKTIALTSGIRLENSTRGGTNPINLSSSLIDLGLDVEVFKKLHLLTGVKMFAVKGTEVQTGRDEVNQIISFAPTTFDETQNVYAVGLTYDFDKKAYFSLQSNWVNYEEANVEKSAFDLNQLFIVYGMKF